MQVSDGVVRMDTDSDGEAATGAAGADVVYERLVQSTSDAIVVFDADGRILFANDATGRLTGYAPRQLVGRPAARLLPERLREWFRASLRTYVETGRRSVDWHGLELLVERRDGTELPVSVTVAAHETDGRLRLSATIRDASVSVERRERLERELAAREADVDALVGALSTARTALVAARDADADAGRGTDAAVDVDVDADGHVDDPVPDPDGGGPDRDRDHHLELDADPVPDLDGAIADATAALAALDREASGTSAEDPVDGAQRETTCVSLPDIAADAWADAGVEGSLRLDGFGTVTGDPDRLRAILGHLFRAQAGRADAPVVRVGPTDEGAGFYVAATPGSGPADSAEATDSLVGSAVRLADEAGWTTTVEVDGERRVVVRPD
jgi:PAS domain S-box-containing protein